MMLDYQVRSFPQGIETNQRLLFHYNSYRLSIIRTLDKPVQKQPYQFYLLVPRLSQHEVVLSQLL